MVKKIFKTPVLSAAAAVVKKWISPHTRTFPDHPLAQHGITKEDRHLESSITDCIKSIRLERNTALEEYICVNLS